MSSQTLFAGAPIFQPIEQLPSLFFTPWRPLSLEQPKTLLFNEPLACALGLNLQQLQGMAGAKELAGQGRQGVAMAYAGHQFGHFVPQLGDGRALLLGSLKSQGTFYDIHLKGSGPTPYARGGDGLCPLGPAIREFLVSEAMYALGVPTTRALSVVETGISTYRDKELPGAILTRVAKSHIRGGTFELAFHQGQLSDLQKLADFSIERSDPTVASATQPYEALYREVVSSQAKLVAQWMLIGFVHGVMNTDNMSLSGETIDYGPCAYLDAYDPNKVFSFIDQQGRYAYSNQPAIAYWNLHVLGKVMSPLFDDPEPVQEALHNYWSLFNTAWEKGMCHKLGLAFDDPKAQGLIDRLLVLMAQNQADYTATFLQLTEESREGFSQLFMKAEAAKEWFDQWSTMATADGKDNMGQYNPIYIPRNHLVERAIQQAYQGDLRGAIQLLQALRNPFVKEKGTSELSRPPSKEEQVQQTFCGT